MLLKSAQEEKNERRNGMVMGGRKQHYILDRAARKILPEKDGILSIELKVRELIMQTSIKRTSSKAGA